MAMKTLLSPGAEVEIIDDSAYAVSATGSVPLIIVATAQDKLNQSGTSAQYTTANTSGNLYLETSQRSLVTDYGVPVFITSDGSPVHGSEQNEYGLATAYETLGVSDSVYILRAPIDLNTLSGSTTPPTANAATGTVWLDSANTIWGILKYNASLQSFTTITTTNTSGNGKLWVITDTSQTVDYAYSIPATSIGKPGDYAVVLTNVNNPVWYLDSAGVWVEVDTVIWQASIPAVTGAVASPTDVTGNLILNGTTLNFSADSLSNVVANIRTAAITGISAIDISNRLGLTVTSAATNDLVTVAGTAISQLGLTAGSYYAPQFQASPYTSVPSWNSTDALPAPTGSIWFNTTPYENGANIAVKVMNSNIWVTNTVTVAANDAALNYALDPLGGGINIAAGIFALELGTTGFTTNLLERQAGSTTLTGTNANVALTGTTPFGFTINTSVAGSNIFYGNTAVSFTGNTASALINAVNALSLEGISAGLSSSNTIEIQNTSGGTFYLYDDVNTTLEKAGLLPTGKTSIKVSNWVAPTYVIGSSEPTADPLDGTIWYYDDPTVVDIMINTGAAWCGYRTVTANLEARGYNLTLTDAAGPIVSASVPSTQSTGNALVNGDLWINTDDLTNLPNINRYQSGSWVQISNTDHTSSNGIIFTDARWATSGDVDPATDTLPAISELLLSNYLDSDAPSYALYPRGTLLFNTRRSGMNVKTFTTDYLTATETSSWVTASGNDENSVPYQGSAAQRRMVVKSMISAVENSNEILDDTYSFSLVSAPGYIELLPTLKTFNAEQEIPSFLVHDAPMTLRPTTSALSNWASNTNGADSDGVTGLVTYDSYSGVYYSAGYTTDLNGNNVVVPASYMALPTILNSDAMSYPWFAPAGTKRGLVSDVTAIGYIDSNTGDFVSNSVSKTLRDVLYPLKVNPISNIKGSGITLYGQKTRSALVSGEETELSRINVVRLVIYLANKLNQLAKTYVFEQNDSITRKNFGFAIGQLLSTAQTQRGISDYAVDVSTDINTQARIDNNELWAAVGISPITSTEYIYIPLTSYAAATDLGGGTISY